jgi:hypothetical protein
MKEPIMANTTPTEQTDDIEIDFINLNESAPSNKYEAHVLKLIAADEKRTKEQIDDGVHASVRLEFPKTENGKPAIERYKRWFRESAAAHNVSAKVAGEKDLGDTIEFRYVVVPKIVRPRKDKTVAAPVDESDVPTAA